jgi:tellurite resistance protein TerC
VIFAVDSVPAVLAVSHEPFIVFSSNAFAILGLRALYFLLADLHARFRYLQTGLAVILAFVGVKMIVQQAFDFHINTFLSLGVIAAILGVSIGASLLRREPEAPHEPESDEAMAEAVHDAFDHDPSTDPRVTGDHAMRDQR